MYVSTSFRVKRSHVIVFFYIILNVNFKIAKSISTTIEGLYLCQMNGYFILFLG